jgi:hypothetical protein
MAEGSRAGVVLSPAKDYEESTPMATSLRGVRSSTVVPDLARSVVSCSRPRATLQDVPSGTAGHGCAVASMSVNSGAVVSLPC